jgi:tetratricopeptide (TPR) repeat protein
MSAASVNPAPIARWQARAAEQLYACLALAGKRQELEDLLDLPRTRASEPALRYYLGLAWAREGQLEPAIRHLRVAAAQAPEQILPRKLLYKLLVRQAAQKAKQRDSRGLSEAVAAAFEVAPPGVDPRRDLAPFQSALPVAHIRSGNRREAARIWEQQLREDPGNPQILRNLAVLYFWWARHEERGPNPAAEPPWKDAVAFWTVLLNIGSYWEEFRRKKEKVWKLPFPAQDLESFRASFLDEHVCRTFRDRASECKERHDEAGAQRYEGYLTAALLEKRSAACWQQGWALLHREMVTGCGRPGLIDLPAGCHFFERFGLLRQAGEFIAELAEKEPGADCLPWLRIYFSPAGLGRIAVLIEERHRPGEALPLLDKLPAAVKDSPEAGYLRSRALARQGASLFQRGQTQEALKSWKEAFRLIKEHLPKLPAKSAFQRLFKDLREETGKQLGAAVVEEATRLKQEDKRDEAARLLEQTLEVSDDQAVKDLLCVLYCERGHERLGKQRYAAAREEFQKALKLNPKHPTARAGMSTAYNNEGADNSDLDESIRLLEKAVEYNPDNVVAQKNLAMCKLVRRQRRGY